MFVFHRTFWITLLLQFIKELPEETKEFLNSVHQQDIDWEVVGENLDLWVEKVELEFVK